MNDSQNRVSNIFVNDLKEFKEQLIQDLISLGISYVQIDNEFHFLDRIYRFYDKEEIRLRFAIENVEVIGKKVVKTASHKLINKQLIKRDNRICNNKLNNFRYNNRIFNKYYK